MGLHLKWLKEVEEGQIHQSAIEEKPRMISPVVMYYQQGTMQQPWLLEETMLCF